MANDNVHDRHDQPTAADVESENSSPKRNKTSQKTRDAHFLENGVDAKGNTPKDVEYDAEGNISKKAE